MKNYHTDPAEIVLADESVSASIAHTTGDEWLITIVIARQPAAMLIDPDAINADLLSSDNHKFTIAARPEQALVEAGGSMHTSANAVFRFNGVNKEADKLIVYWRNQALHFRIVRYN